MKRGLSLLLLGMMMFSLTACGGSDNSNSKEDDVAVKDDFVEEETIEESNIPEGWEEAKIPYAAENLKFYFNPEVLRYADGGVFGNAKGTDPLVVSIDVVDVATVEDYMNEKYNAYVEDTLNPKQNVVLGEIETSACGDFTIYKATISYESKQYDLGENFDKAHEYTPEEMEQFPVTWVPETNDVELVKLTDGCYIKTLVSVGDLETFLGAIIVENVE